MIKGLIQKIKDNRFFQNNTVKQFIKFGIIGFSNTVLSYVLYLVFLKLFERFGLFPQHDYIISSVCTFFICTVWSFYWNSRFTFKTGDGEKRNIIKAFVKTVISYSFTGLLLHNIILYVFVEWVHLPKEIVPLISLVVTVPTNFLLNKYWAFRSE